MRILIADDESIIRLGLISMLQELGHEVIAATNGREALQMARRHRPDLTILDIKMPFTDGLQAARTLARTQPMPILLLTAFSDTELVEQATDLPVHGYLVKPIRTADLAAAIAVASKRFAESRQERDRSARLEQRLAERKLIERAKGRLIQTGLSEEMAFRTLQKLARDRRQSLFQVAESILGQSG